MFTMSQIELNKEYPAYAFAYQAMLFHTKGANPGMYLHCMKRKLEKMNFIRLNQNLSHKELRSWDKSLPRKQNNKYYLSLNK